MKKILDGEEIKKILYSVIEDEVGKKTIQTEITSDIGSSQKYMSFIMSSRLVPYHQKEGLDWMT
jgi:hypothetical protein